MKFLLILGALCLVGVAHAEDVAQSEPDRQPSCMEQKLDAVFATISDLPENLRQNCFAVEKMDDKVTGAIKKLNDAHENLRGVIRRFRDGEIKSFLDYLKQLFLAVAAYRSAANDLIRAGGRSVAKCIENELKQVIEAADADCITQN